ncbi:hypothetical protein [Cellulomonas sp. GbtcB1]|uniref:hypothetical protein n=1 Tax=Cellulomonas sp. GbtcB1 TaxID=2824746 RepID=UPI001C31006D|nr:hypothetical protein [Cellulomonas sp. GbtcB1]
MNVPRGELQAPPAVRRPEAVRRTAELAGAAVRELPDRAPVVLLALGLAALLAVLAGQFRPVVVLPVAVVLVVVTWRWVPSSPAGRRHLLAALAALALVAGWAVWGWSRAGEYVVVNRDPGFLTLKALWLTHHSSSAIPVGSAEAAAAATAGGSAATEAFWLQDGALHAQGSSMLPALLAVLGWGGGEQAVLAGGTVLGAVALLAVFAAARRVAGPFWALTPVAALAASLPFLVGTRAAYTEPLTIALLCGGLAVGHGAWRRGAVGTHALAGLLLGAVGAARIDGAVVLVGLAVGCAAAGASPPGRADRRAATRGGLAALSAGAAMVGLGLADVLLLSPEYARVHTTQLRALLVAAGLVVVLTVLVLVLPSAWLQRVRAAALDRRRGSGRVAMAVIVAAGVVLASRPSWWQGHYVDPSSGAGYAVQILQAAAGEPLDATRSYDERTLAWVGWYLGVPAVVLGFAGLALLARRAVAGRDPAATVVAAVIGVAAVFPLVRASITPDQVWAVRRLLPATFPGLLIAGAVALQALAGARWSGVLPAAARRVVAAGLALAVVAFPLTTWRPGASVVELSGRATQAHAVCDALDGLGVERVVWTHSSPFRYLATLRVLCDVEVVEFVTPPTTADLAAVRAAWGGGPVAALSFDPGSYVWTVPPAGSVGRTASTTLGRTLTGVPRTVDTTWSEVWIGLVQPDGTVAPAG